MTTFKIDKETVEVKVTLAFKRGEEPTTTLCAVQEALNGIKGVDAFLVDSIEEEEFALFEHKGEYELFKKATGRRGVWEPTTQTEYHEAREAES